MKRNLQRLRGALLITALGAGLAGCAATPRATTGTEVQRLSNAPTTVTSVAPRQMLAQIRSSAGRPALKRNPALRRAAERHAASMARHGYFSHDGRNGSSPGDRARAAGYKWCSVAENIARGQASPQQAITEWMGSRGHRKNILNAKMTEYGMAQVGDVYVMVVARPC